MKKINWHRVFGYMLLTITTPLFSLSAALSAWNAAATMMIFSFFILATLEMTEGKNK